MTYDAVIVLGGGIAKTSQGGFRPSTYADTDAFGMLGGEIRITAATCLHDAEASQTFVFSTGISPKMREKYGNSVPTEAAVYSHVFMQSITIGIGNQPAPTIILEDRSHNTVSNLQEVFAIISEQAWEKVAIISVDFHLPRIKALAELLQPPSAQLDFLAAEAIVKQYRPGVYDKEIDDAYSSAEGKKRITNEAQGLRDIRSGKYVLAGITQPEQRNN